MLLVILRLSTGQVTAFYACNTQVFSVDLLAALLQAQALDAKLAAGEHLGPLAGVPVAVKDNICTIGVPTTAASRYVCSQHNLALSFMGRPASLLCIQAIAST